MKLTIYQASRWKSELNMGGNMLKRATKTLWISSHVHWRFVVAIQRCFVKYWLFVLHFLRAHASGKEVKSRVLPQNCCIPKVRVKRIEIREGINWTKMYSSYSTYTSSNRITQGQRLHAVSSISIVKQEQGAYIMLVCSRGACSIKQGLLWACSLPSSLPFMSRSRNRGWTF